MTKERDTILIAPDKFKGTLRAAEVCHIMASLLRENGFSKLSLCPMADGGEGTPPLLAGRKVIVSHDLIGPGCFPGIPVMQRSSFALGKAIMEELQNSRRFYIGLGGTATVDGGAGILQAFGADFYDRHGHIILTPVIPQLLPEISRIDVPDPLRSMLRNRAVVLADVKASLYGPGLSSLDFAAQKGASDSDIDRIAAGLRNLKTLLRPVSDSPFDGAAGGAGFALATIAGAQATYGAKEILANMPIEWDRIAVVISGEGKIDHQTTGGKVPETLRREANRRNIPYIAIGGYVAPEIQATSTPTNIYISCISDPRQFDPAKAAERLRTAALHILPHLRLILNSHPH